MERGLSYENYRLEAPREAFRAFEACLKFADGTGLIFDHGGSKLLADEFLFGVRFKASSAGEHAMVRVTPTQGVTCTWNENENGGNVIEMKDSTQATLHCLREEWTTESAVRIERADGNAAMLLQWPPFVMSNSGDFHPVDAIQDMQSRLGELHERQEQLEPSALKILSGSVLIDHGENPDLLHPGPNACSTRRGTMNGSVKFESSFQDAPKVIVALNNLSILTDPDYGYGNARLNVQVTGVTAEGFSYEFNTWCNAKVQHAKADWIAYGK